MDFYYVNMWEVILDVILDWMLIIYGILKCLWVEVDDCVVCICFVLMDVGFELGLKVGFYFMNCLEYIEVYYGVFKGWFIFINVNYRYLEDEFVYFLDNSDCEVLVFYC